MKHATLESRMRALEHYRDARTLPETWTVIRVDGRSFSKMTAAHFQKPFDRRFHQAMVAVGKALMRELRGLYAYTESDELSILLPRDWRMFGGRVEKIVSVAAGVASSVFTRETGVLAHFDARIWLGPTEASVVDYFRWRQGDALRCSLNGWCYWTLRQAGKSAGRATALLSGGSFESKRALLADHGVELEALEGWQRQGVGLREETYRKQGFDPKLGRAVETTRKRLRLEADLPLGRAYSDWLADLLRESSESSSRA